MRDTTSSTYAARLPFLGVLRFQGRDAASFLQGQVTHDTRLLADGRTLLTACNTPQGRVIALLRLRQTGAAVHALLPAELLEHVASRLRRFVLRAKVEVQIATDLQLAWVGGLPFAAALAVESREASRTASTMPVAGDAEVITFDYDAHRRVVAAAGPALQAMTGLSLSQSLPDIEQAWWAADIAAGLPQVLRAGSEQFVPQMLNLDLLDGISFTKGCYTGQEIVARTQHLGRIKRRTFRYRVTGREPLAPLTGLRLAGTKVAEVVMSAPCGDAVELLAVTQLDARDRALVTEDGREAVPMELPYRIGDGA